MNMKTSLLFVVGIFLPFLVSAAPPSENWQLTKAYEFNQPNGELELAEWDTRYVWDRDTIINNEQQYYVDPTTSLPNPFWIDNGALFITASPGDYKGQSFTSGVLTTRSNGHSQLYGYWEASIKLPKARGAWPAFWLLPTHNQWPSGISVLSEIDIMEAVSDVGEGTYHASIHSNQTGSLVSSSKKIVTDLDLTGTFNVYGLEWNEDYVAWYLNDVEVHREETPSDMNVARHLLLNLAVGGWGGDVVASDYPAHMVVNYVRVYKETSPNPPSEYPVEFQRLVDHLFKVYEGKL